VDCIDAIKTRRSIRIFKPDPVDEQDLQTILEAGRWAPSAGNLQPCYFVVVREEEQRKKVREAALDQDALATAPVIIVVCADPQRSSKYGERGMNHFCLLDCANAAENMLLAAQALGYGSCWMGGFSEGRMKKVLELPADFRVVAVIPIGRPGEAPEPRDRRPLSDLVRWDRW